ncbi:MAG: HD domain-containing protein [Candidatus Marinimicrobia bacterium]|nr:HD domain-containing protein [Candidatus Neomarinimicrobiota bacterium]
MNKAALNEKTQHLISSLEIVYDLKTIPRSGWIQSGIQPGNVESIASHSYGMSILILFLRSRLHAAGIDVERAINMALVHDLAEAITGDYTPVDGISSADKHAEESSAFENITNQIQEKEYLCELWNEFESGETQEARLVKRIDKLDMLVQAYLYEKKYSVNLDSFWENMDELFLASESESIYNYLRKNRFQGKG